VKPLVETKFRLRTLGSGPGARAMAATLTGFERYLNARCLICWLDEVIAHLFEMQQLICTRARHWESQRNERISSTTNHVDEDQYAVFCLVHFGMLDFARIGGS
jgi:hypothetical protein